MPDLIKDSVGSLLRAATNRQSVVFGAILDPNDKVEPIIIFSNVTEKGEAFIMLLRETADLLEERAGSIKEQPIPKWVT